MNKPKYRRLADGGTIKISDGLQNVVANLNTPRDKQYHSHYVTRQWTDGELDATYRSSWLARKVIDTIPEDATSKWRAWQANSNQTSALEAEEKRLRLPIKVKDAMISARLFGSAAIYIGTGDADPSKPLNADGVKKGGIRHLTVLSKNQIVPGEVETDPESLWFGYPATYSLNTEGNEVVIHPSRLVILHGASRPVGGSSISHQMSPKAVGGGAYFSGNAGWGDSVIQVIYEALRNADSAAANIASLIYEANVDVLMVPNLMELLQQPNGDAVVRNYLSMQAASKGINGMMVLDGGGQDGEGRKVDGTNYDRKGAQFAGLADLWDRFMIAVSGASDIPATYLFGMSPSGQNSTGESDMRNYAKRIDTMQRMEMEPAMSILDECLIRSALGSRPEDIHYNWRPSFEATDKEKAEIAASVASTISTLKATGLFPIEVLQNAGSNAIIEIGALPGWESAVEAHGLSLEAPDGEEELAAMGEATEV